MRTFKSKKELQEAIKQSLSNDNVAVRALLRIFEYQTVDEKSLNQTVHNNGVGFTGRDADILTSFSKQVLSKRSLSEKQMGVLKKVIVKYANQLMEQAIQRGLYKKIDGVWVIV